MLIKIPYFEPVQMALTLFCDTTLYCVVKAVNLILGKKIALSCSLDVVAGDFTGRNLYFRTMAAGSLARQFFSSCGIETGNGINIESTHIEGRHVLVDVTRESKNMMYDRILGFRPASNTCMNQQ